MSLIDTQVTNEMVIPRIETDIFVGHEAARFAVGILAVENEVVANRHEEYLGYLRLRANVYADQTNIIPKEQVLADGTERDKDDIRSVHFAVIENLGNSQRVIAAMRLIVKSQKDSRPLPIEGYFPEVFEGAAASEKSIEVSRYICRHEDPRIQGRLKWPLYKLGLSYAMVNDLGPTYAIIETPLERQLGMAGVSTHRIAEAKFIEDYNSSNMAVEIDTNKLANAMNLSKEAVVNQALAAKDQMIYFDTQDEQSGLAVA